MAILVAWRHPVVAGGRQPGRRSARDHAREPQGSRTRRRLGGRRLRTIGRGRDGPSRLRRGEERAARGSRGRRGAAEAEWQAAESLLSDLVHGNRHGVPLEARANLADVSLSRPHVLVLVTGRERRTPPPSSREVSGAFAAAGGHVSVLATGTAGGVVAMVPVPDGPVRGVIDAVRELVASALQRLSAAGLLVGAVSTICRSPDDYAGAYSEIREVAGLAQRMPGEDANTVLAVDDFGAGRLLLRGNDRHIAERFVVDALGSLLDPDDKKQVDLLMTLATFLGLSRNVRRCAQRLGVHENTIRYRLACIEEMTGLAVSVDSDAQLTVQLALLVLRLQGRLPRGYGADSGRGQHSCPYDNGETPPAGDGRD